MLSYVLRRLILLLVCVFGVLVITFILTNVLPGDPAFIAAGKFPTPKAIESLRKEMGLDKPLLQQFLIYAHRVFLRLDLGKSIISKRPVVEDIKAYFPATLELITISLILMIFLGIPAGVMSAVKQNSWLDHTVRGLSIAGISMPEFWLAMILQLFAFYAINGWPIDSRVSLAVSMDSPLRTITGLLLVDSLLQWNIPVFLSALQHIALPALTLTICHMANIARISRAAMIEVLYQDYIRTAKAMGIHPLKVVLKYGLRNALIPILTVAGMLYGFLLGGTILVELVFSWPGLGRYVVKAITLLDFPAVMGVTLFSATIVVLLNFIVDLLYTVVNPSVKYE